MRDLTDEELALAPACCDMYFINRSDFAVYVNSETKEFHAPWLSSPVAPGACHYGFQRMRPIKPFDITKHEWSDRECQLNNYPSRGERLEFYCESSLDGDGGFFGFEVNRDDAIAIAKHFNLTADDLK